MYTAGMALNTLSQLGLSDRDVKIYTTLLRRGPMKPAELAKATNINRTTLYSIAKKLIGKGLIAEDVSLPVTQLVPSDPKQLGELLNQERLKLKEKEASVKEAIGELSLIAKESSHPVPKIQFITEQQIGKFLFSQAKKWNRSAQKIDKTWWGFQDHELVEQHEPWIQWLWKEVYAPDDHVKLFSNHAQIETKLRAKFPHRQIKVLKDSSKFTATTWVMGDYIVMVFLSGSPKYLIEIHDATMAQNMRAVFASLWAKS